MLETVIFIIGQINAFLLNPLGWGSIPFRQYAPVLLYLPVTGRF